MINFLQLLRVVAWKEMIQVSRDRLTLGLLLGVPLLQLLLFGYAITLHPRALPTAVVASEDSSMLERAIGEMEETGYFKIVARTKNAATAENLMLESRVQFILVGPEQALEIMRNGKALQLKLIADTTDPISSTAALNALGRQFAMPEKTFVAALPIELTVERKYNADSVSAIYIVPGLLGVILTLTLTLLAALCIVRELEHGTWEGLIATPLPPLAVLLGKIIPYLVLGFVQTAFILILAMLLFDIPWLGSVTGLLIATGLFMLANLGLGIVFSLLARNQMQAMQMGIFFYLPSILLSGFMFPFYGMPKWAQWLGEILPLTHYLRIIRGALIKGAGDQIVLLLSWPIGLFALVTMSLAAVLYRHKL